MQSRTVATLSQLRTAAREMAGRFGLHLVVVFGSAARQEATPEDLDIGVQGAGPVDVVALTNTLTQALKTQAVDVTDLSRADPLLLALVAREGQPLFEAEPGRFAHFVSVAARRFADTRKFREAQTEVLRGMTGGGRPST